MQIAICKDSVLLRNTRDEYALVKGIADSKFNKKLGAWEVPKTLEMLNRLRRMFPLPPTAENERRRLETKQRLIDAERLNKEPLPMYPYPVKVNLFQHQTRGANMSLIALGLNGEPTRENGAGFGFLFEMGCGKTLTALAVLGAALQKGAVKRVLIVAPASVVPVWSKEFEDFADYPYTVQALQGTAKQKVSRLDDLTIAERYQTEQGVFAAVINYESVWRDDVYAAIEKWRPDMIICDESQRIKSNAAKQSKAMHKLGDIARYKLILSGTPIQNSAMDLWSQYRFLDKRIFGDNFYKFRARYAVMGGFNGKQVVATRDIDTLTEKAHSIAYRVTKAEALDLPEQMFENRAVEMSPKERKIYNDIKRESYAELENESVTAAMITTRLLRLQQITGGFVQYDGKADPTQTGKGKLNALEDIVDDYVIDGGKKLVVFARFIPEIHAICEMLDKKKLPNGKKMQYSRIWGEIPLAERGEQVERFQKAPDVRVFVAQIDTAGLGITLTAADTAVYYSLNYNYAAYEQSLARIHRIGQKNTCTYIHLVCPGTIDMQILRALHKKEDLAKTIVDNWRMYFE